MYNPVLMVTFSETRTKRPDIFEMVRHNYLFKIKILIRHHEVLQLINPLRMHQGITVVVLGVCV